MRPKIIIWGASRHALVVADILALNDEFELAGYIDDVTPDRRGEIFGNKPILGGRESLEIARKSGVSHLIFGFGRSDVKPGLAQTALSLGYYFATAVHPAAQFPEGVQLGPGSVVKAGAVMDPEVRIGEHTIVGANSVITHGAYLDDYARISASAVVGTEAGIGRLALVGIGSVVNGAIQVGDGAVVGAGAVVIRDVPAGVVVVGNPARVLREARPDDF